MKTPRIGAFGALGLVAVMAAAVLIPASAMSQRKPAGAPPAVPEAARKAGMAQAPAIVTAMGLPCQVSDARLIGADKKLKTSYFEVACGAGNMGFVVQAPEAAPASAFTCVEANTPPAPGQPPSAPCLLPGNADPKGALAPVLKTAGFNCTPDQARGVGQTKTETYLEVACAGGGGYIVATSAPFDAAKPAKVVNCLLYDESDSNIKCTFGDKAARIAVVDRYAADANNGCAVKDRRFVGVSRDNSTYYEASCQDGKGYIYKVAAAGNLAETYECAKASQILGGCTLTDARQALNEQAGLYTRLVTNAGGKCDVDKYALFPTRNPREEVAELVCKDGSGAILLSTAGQKSVVMDCGRAPVAGYKCSLGKDPGYSFLTADLKKFRSDTTCAVSNSRVVGKTEKGTTFMEVACSDGLKGYVIEYQTAPAVSAVQAVGCAFAGGGTCKLPGNT